MWSHTTSLGSPRGAAKPALRRRWRAGPTSARTGKEPRGGVRMLREVADLTGRPAQHLRRGYLFWPAPGPVVAGLGTRRRRGGLHPGQRQCGEWGMCRRLVEHDKATVDAAPVPYSGCPVMSIPASLSTRPQQTIDTPTTKGRRSNPETTTDSSPAIQSWGGMRDGAGGAAITG